MPSIGRRSGVRRWGRARRRRPLRQAHAGGLLPAALAQSAPGGGNSQGGPRMTRLEGKEPLILQGEGPLTTGELEGGRFPLVTRVSPAVAETPRWSLRGQGRG
jgi:hypothetical protein